MQVTWEIFKGVVDSRWLSIQYVEIGDNYWMKAIDGPFIIECVIPKDPLHEETADFLANYFSNANIPYTDSDGRPIQKVAAARRGATYLANFCEITTSLSIESKKWDGTEGDFSVSFYDSLNSSLPSSDINCVKTIVTMSPSISYEIVAGKIHVPVMADQPTRLWVIAGATDLSAYQGTVVEMIRNVPLHHVQNSLVSDGRASKYLAFSTSGVPVPTNKLQFIIKHNPGYQFSFCSSVELFR